jgi:hypothetical protein
MSDVVYISKSRIERKHGQGVQQSNWGDGRNPRVYTVDGAKQFRKRSRLR